MRAAVLTGSPQVGCCMAQSRQCLVIVFRYVIRFLCGSPINGEKRWESPSTRVQKAHESRPIARPFKQGGVHVGSHINSRTFAQLQMFLHTVAMADRGGGGLGVPWNSPLCQDAQHSYMLPDLGLNPPYCLLYEILVSCIFDKFYSRANPPASLRPIARFAQELERFVCDCITLTKIEKLRSKGVAMHTCSFPVYYT